MQLGSKVREIQFSEMDEKLRNRVRQLFYKIGFNNWEYLGTVTEETREGLYHGEEKEYQFLMLVDYADRCFVTISEDTTMSRRRVRYFVSVWGRNYHGTLPAYNRHFMG